MVTTSSVSENLYTLVPTLPVGVFEFTVKVSPLSWAVLLRVMLLGIGSSTSWPNIKVDEAFSTPESLFNEILFPSTTTSSLGLSVSAALALSSGMPTEAN
jgi:hypothetical protein